MRTATLLILFMLCVAACPADSITVTYDDVHVSEYSDSYFIRMPSTGTVVRLLKQNVSSGNVSITQDEAAREALLKQWEGNRKKRQAAASAADSRTETPLMKPVADVGKNSEAVAPESLTTELTELRERASSDDARTIEEAILHGRARGVVILHIKPNKLNVGGREFRVKRNPVGEGCFVYDPRIDLPAVHGIRWERNHVWWVAKEGTAYPLNSPSKMVTPNLKWPREDYIDSPSTSSVLDYVFDGKPMKSEHTFKKRPRVSTSESSKKFGLTEKERQAVYNELWDAFRANTETAEQKYPVDYGGTAQQIVQQQEVQFDFQILLDEKSERAVAAKHGLTSEQMDTINEEAIKKDW